MFAYYLNWINQGRTGMLVVEIRLVPTHRIGLKVENEIVFLFFVFLMRASIKAEKRHIDDWGPD